MGNPLPTKRIGVAGLNVPGIFYKSGCNSCSFGSRSPVRDYEGQSDQKHWRFYLGLHFGVGWRIPDTRRNQSMNKVKPIRPTSSRLPLQQMAYSPQSQNWETTPFECI